VEPIPETVEALRELTRYGDDTVARTLLAISRDIERIVPEIVGVSLSLVSDEDNLTFTLTATSGPVAELDGMQYLAGGPCEETLSSGELRTFQAGDPVSEERWQVFAQATSAAGVASTLSMPIVRGGVVVAGINMYASTPDAFEGRNQALAQACGAWAEGAVSNADLDFTTRMEAAETPGRLQTEYLVDQAVGALMSRWGITVEESEERLRQAAQRAGISDAQMARAILGLLVDHADGDPREGVDGPE
jgi:GAF domain-containing protein